MSDTPRTDWAMARQMEATDLVVLAKDMRQLERDLAATVRAAEGLAEKVREALEGEEHTQACERSSYIAGTVGQRFCHVGVLRAALDAWEQQSAKAPPSPS